MDQQTPSTPPKRNRRQRHLQKTVAQHGAWKSAAELENQLGLRASYPLSGVYHPFIIDQLSQPKLLVMPWKIDMSLCFHQHETYAVMGVVRGSTQTAWIYSPSAQAFIAEFVRRFPRIVEAVYKSSVCGIHSGSNIIEGCSPEDTGTASFWRKQNLPAILLQNDSPEQIVAFHPTVELHRRQSRQRPSSPKFNKHKTLDAEYPISPSARDEEYEFIDLDETSDNVGVTTGKDLVFNEEQDTVPETAQDGEQQTKKKRRRRRRSRKGKTDASNEKSDEDVDDEHGQPHKPSQVDKISDQLQKLQIQDAKGKQKDAESSTQELKATNASLAKQQDHVEAAPVKKSFLMALMSQPQPKKTTDTVTAEAPDIQSGQQQMATVKTKVVTAPTPSAKLKIETEKPDDVASHPTAKNTSYASAAQVKAPIKKASTDKGKTESEKVPNQKPQAPATNPSKSGPVTETSKPGKRGATKTLDLGSLIDMKLKKATVRANPTPFRKVKNPTRSKKAVVVSAKKKGIQRSKPKTRRVSKLKKIILQDRKDKYAAYLAAKHAAQSSNQELNSDAQEYVTEEESEQPTPIEHKGSSAGPSVAIEFSQGDQETTRQFYNRLRKIPKVATTPKSAREYCEQVISPALNTMLKEMISKLFSFQERARKKEPLKFARNRRLVSGLREVPRWLRRQRLKCIIITPTVEEISAPGGVDAIILQIIADARRLGVPVIFGMTRNSMGRALNRRARTCVVGIINPDGANDIYKQVLIRVEALRREFQQMKVKEHSPEATQTLALQV
eukprot:TRINITY_DN2851_c0_g1_i2.p1 TRINITY_DN2851_c0_g1~~TRINITY_DN2851_c0_g1_i2.p1  ORF type:complete len:783 (+),score=162.32 TRINITY_DN2851_c0_g1_i2:45-2393(+)